MVSIIIIDLTVLWGKCYSHVHCYYVRELQLEFWSPDSGQCSKLRAVVIIAPPPPQQHSNCLCSQMDSAGPRVLGREFDISRFQGTRFWLKGTHLCTGRAWAGLFAWRYLKHTLDQYVESDYTLLYLHHGLTSDNKPSFSWLRDAYREFDRKWVGARGGVQGLEQVLGQELIPCQGKSGAHTWVHAKNLKMEQPELKSVSLPTHSVTFHVT